MTAKQDACDCRLGVVADVGQTLNSSTTYQHLVANNPDVSCLPRTVHCVDPPVCHAFHFHASHACAVTVHELWPHRRQFQQDRAEELYL